MAEIPALTSLAGSHLQNDALDGTSSSAIDTLQVRAVEVTQEINESGTEDSPSEHAHDHAYSAEDGHSHEHGHDCDHEHDHEHEHGSSDGGSLDLESLFEDALEGISEGRTLKDDPDAFSPEEALHIRQQLRALKPTVFLETYLFSGQYTARKLCTAFGICPPEFLDGQPDEAFCSLLNIGLSREISKRHKLPEYNTVDDVVSLIEKSKNIIVITGAGISTSLGIPDFRSKDTGLYSQLAHLGLSDPQEVFDIHLFREDPSIFYSIAPSLLPAAINAAKRFSPTHAFIALLQSQGKLLTNYTQNIDNIESHAGISPEKLIQCHGSFATASCIVCNLKVDGTEVIPTILLGKTPRCPRCIARIHALPKSLKRKPSRSSSRSKKNGDRSASPSSSSSETDEEPGVMKPDITFFGEALPPTFFDRFTLDAPLVDLIITIGTSLKVAPVSEIPRAVGADVPQVYFSREGVKHVDFDVSLLGECDVVCAEVCKRLGWSLPGAETADVVVEGMEGGCEWKLQVKPAEKMEEEATALLRT